MAKSLARSGQRLFNKSHVVTYATLACQATWLKATYLPEYNFACQID